MFSRYMRAYPADQAKHRRITDNAVGQITSRHVAQWPMAVMVTAMGKAGINSGALRHRGL